MATSSIPKTSGIYKITCTANGKIYIGSSNNCEHRWMYHRRDLRGGRHHSIYLQRAWNKYGEKSFMFEVIELVMPWSLLDREQYWLDKLKPEFNVSSLAQCPSSWKGRKHTPETRAKISAANMGHMVSIESRAKISKARKGTKRDPAITEKIVSKLRGRKLKPEHIEKVAAKHRGMKRSPLACQNIGESKSKSYIVISPNGDEIEIRNLKKFCRENGLEYTSLAKVAAGTQTHHRNWKCRHTEE